MRFIWMQIHLMGCRESWYNRLYWQSFYLVAVYRQKGFCWGFYKLIRFQQNSAVCQQCSLLENSSEMENIVQTSSGVTKINFTNANIKHIL